MHQGALEEVVLIVSGEDWKREKSENEKNEQWQGEVLAKVAGRDACFTSSRVLWLTRRGL